MKGSQGPAHLITALLCVIIVGSPAWRKDGESRDLEASFWEADFNSILRRLNECEESDLSPEDRLLRIECLVRTGRRIEAEKLAGDLRTSRAGIYPFRLRSRVQATEGIVLFSLGRTDEARRRVQSALEEDPASPRAHLVMIFIALQDRKPFEAASWYEELVRIRPDLSKTYLIYLVGLEVYTAARDPQRMARIYGLRGKERDETGAYFEGLRTNARLVRKTLQKGFFSVSPLRPKAIFPFSRNPDDPRINVIVLEKKGTRFRVILDTGNRAGWTVHNPLLLGWLGSRRGGRVYSEIGIQAGFLEGSTVFTPRLELGGVSIIGLAGHYVPKPRPDFYDAGLNPAFIGNRVITLDYVERRLIIRTKSEFERALGAAPNEKVERFPWLGSGYAFIRVEIQGVRALALIETGAEDISLNLDWARRLGLHLKENERYLSTGETVRHHLAPVRLTLGRYRFERPAAEVWPLSGLAHPLSGLIPDVVIGPHAFAGRYVLSFDPFDHQIVLEEPPNAVSRIVDGNAPSPLF